VNDANLEIAALREELDAKLESLRTEFATRIADAEGRLSERLAEEKRQREEQLSAVRADVRQSLAANTKAVEVVGARVGGIEAEMGDMNDIVRSLGKAMDYLLRAEGLESVKGLVPNE
jgi:DNA anti-recombination protein RmuC